MEGRVTIAGLTAPPVGIATFTAIGIIWYGLDGAPFLLGALESFGLNLFLLIPVTYLLEAAIGVPAYFVLRRFGILRLSTVVAAGAAAGVLPLLAFSGSPLHWPSNTVPLSLLIGGVPGAVAGAWFWVVGFRVRSNPQAT